jgi:4-alpha-glucanotransferase
MTEDAATRAAKRAAGILLHPTSLPGPYGIGDLGPAAHRFVDFLADAGQRLWQVLPLGPTGFGDSPYATRSAFAGSPLLLSPEQLFHDGLLSADDLAGLPEFPPDRVMYEEVERVKFTLLRRAYERFRDRPPSEHDALAAFRARQSAWLEDFALFMALRDANGGAPWTTWEPGLVHHDEPVLARYRQQLADEIDFHVFLQFLFDRQWSALRRHANERGIRIIGDIPIFVAHDSADVWAHQNLFLLNDDGSPAVVAGVPPDYFSPTGQRWGNPLYRWDVMAASGFRWWIDRFRTMLDLVDLIRIDHFRGFVAGWEVPAEHATAEHGRWAPGPGEQLFQAAAAELGPLPIIVEDLGTITPDVIALRERLGYPGMKVLQFAFGDDARNPYLPHNYEPHCVVYTGTHDNDTTAGWFATRPPHEREAVLRYLGRKDCDIVWELLRLALASVAEMAIAPLQDVLGLGSEARLNFPGQPTNNWRWRYREEQLTPETGKRLRDLCATYGR